MQWTCIKGSIKYASKDILYLPTFPKGVPVPAVEKEAGLRTILLRSVGIRAMDHNQSQFEAWARQSAIQVLQVFLDARPRYPKA